jgi:hypothetical protein
LRRNASFEHRDSSADRIGTIRAIRLSVANLNMMLWSDSLETGTGSSNPLRSANESLRTGTATRADAEMSWIADGGHVYYIENLRPRIHSASLVFGQIVHQALAAFFRTGADPTAAPFQALPIPW